jgi:hypothetical protein
MGRGPGSGLMFQFGQWHSDAGIRSAARVKRNCEDRDMEFEEPLEELQFGGTARSASPK